MPVEGTYRITTLGCRVNRADSLEMERHLASLGLRQACDGEDPALWLVNTCAVTAEGVRKSRKAVGKGLQSGAEVVVTGCASEMEPERFEARKGVSAILRKGDLESLARFATGHGAGDGSRMPTTGGLVRVPVKVQDGCRRYCSYCIVPYLRGEPYSRPVREVTDEVRGLASEGAGEVIVCGIDLGGYRDPATGEGLESLLSELTGLGTGMWVRLSSIEVQDVSGPLLEQMDDGGGLCPHLHLPLQSGDGRVLKDMGRDYSPAEFEESVARIRARVPGIGVTTDVMVGFPTETESAFENTRSLLERLGFSRVHVFRYSPRPGTASFALGDPVDVRTKEARAAELRALGGLTASRFHEGLVGRIIPVLVEATMESEHAHVFGRARNFSGVVMPGSESDVGKVVSVLVTSTRGRWLRGDKVGTEQECKET